MLGPCSTTSQYLKWTQLIIWIQRVVSLQPLSPHKPISTTGFARPTGLKPLELIVKLHPMKRLDSIVDLALLQVNGIKIQQQTHFSHFSSCQTVTQLLVLPETVFSSLPVHLTLDMMLSIQLPTDQRNPQRLSMLTSA